MHFQWSQIEALIAEAQIRSSVTVEFPTKRIAKLFTYSVYNFRRVKKLEKTLSLVSITELDPQTLEPKYFVTLYKPVEIYLKKVNHPTNI